MNTDEVDSKLQQIVAGTDHDMSWARDQFEKGMAEGRENATGALSDDQLRRYAVSYVQSNVVHGSRSSFGETKEVNVLTIGHGGVRQWSDRDNGGEKDVLISYGVVQPGVDEDGNELPMGVGVFINDETDGVDLGNIRSAFGSTMKNLRGYYSVQESDELTIGGDTPVYVCNSDEDGKTFVEEVESDMSDEEKREFLHRYITEEATIANIHQHISATNDEGYAAEFGADIKRMNAMVVDWNKGDGFNTYTLLDDSVVDPEELGEDIVSDQARSPGLTAWVPDEFHQYGNNSQLEVYGSIQRDNETGQITMNICGVIPLIPLEMDTDDSGGSETEMNTTESRI